MNTWNNYVAKLEGRRQMPSWASPSPLTLIQKEFLSMHCELNAKEIDRLSFKEATELISQKMESWR